MLRRRATRKRPRYAALTREAREELRSTLPAVAAGLESGLVDLRTIIDVHQLVTSSPGSSTWHAVFDAVLEAFELHRGEIESLDLAVHQLAGAVLTKRGFLQMASPGGAPEVDRESRRLVRLQTRAEEIMRGSTLRMFGEELWGPVTYLVGIFDQPAGYATLTPAQTSSLQYVKSAIDEFEAEFPARAAVAARLRYFRGTVLALLALAPVIGALVVALSLTPGTNEGVRNLVVTFSAGALGGTMSVLTRMTAENLQVDYQVGTDTLQILGGLRPLVGGVFGLALFALIHGDVLPIEVATGGAAQLYAYAGLAFIAGFSERFAQDAITHSQAPLPR